ncbi:cytochrome b/b6 domain-containing protein [Chamaesiphon sp. OTE_75_metabat_556]|uniref:cytochrome b/b6 domain-containing protein n=1 Tax=Chamaesiphon sp. OTE_75_metabat_556 TaxID=2964692 RepID=UPI00286C01BA|nr:cytochrome b/b6 domain-containing protein [Chamaesiphon sp. OTE_75_metabat_556]
MTSQTEKSIGGQPTIVQLFHWINIISLFGMIASGLQIYNANPVFGGRDGIHIPWLITLGGWLAGGRNWHFALMWIYGLNLLAYGVYIFWTKRWRDRFGNTQDVKALQASSNPKRRNYAWHRIVYTSIIPILILAIATGLSMYQPVQFYWLANLFGDWQTLRTAHFMTVPLVLLFTLVHSSLALGIGEGKIATKFLKLKQE